MSNGEVIGVENGDFSVVCSRVEQLRVENSYVMSAFRIGVEMITCQMIKREEWMR